MALLWPTCTRGFGIREKIRCGLRFFGVFLCGFAVFGPPLRPPPNLPFSNRVQYRFHKLKKLIHLQQEKFVKALSEERKICECSPTYIHDSHMHVFLKSGQTNSFPNVMCVRNSLIIKFNEMF